MKRPILISLVILGIVIVAIPIFAILYILIMKPFGIELQNIPNAIMRTRDASTSSSYDHPLLTTEQEKALEGVGIDTSTLPTSITPEQIACFTETLGAARVQELLDGATIGITDVYKAQKCMQ